MTDWHTVFMHLLTAHPYVEVTVTANPSGTRTAILKAGTITVERPLAGLPDAHDELHVFGAEDHHHGGLLDPPRRPRDPDLELIAYLEGDR